MASPKVLPDIVDIYKFPIILLVSLAAALLATYLHPPDPEEVLKDFYRRVRPRGFWGPIHALVVKENRGFQRNKDFLRDVFNIAVNSPSPSRAKSASCRFTTTKSPRHAVLRMWTRITARSFPSAMD